MASVYVHYPEACVNGHNIILHRNISTAECASLCNSYGTGCVGFEFGVPYGGGGSYQANDCQLSSSADMTGCLGEYHNLDFYQRTDATPCTESCNYASDGDCDDGGPGSEYSSCQLGTDCTDCGLSDWAGSSPMAALPPMAPSVPLTPSLPPSPPAPPPLSPAPRTSSALSHEPGCDASLFYSQAVALQCTDISGDLVILHEAITTLEALSCLVSVGGTVIIAYNSALASLAGLSSLSFVGGSLSILDNGALRSLDGLHALVKIGTLHVEGNVLLSEASGVCAAAVARAVEIHVGTAVHTTLDYCAPADCDGSLTYQRAVTLGCTSVTGRLAIVDTQLTSLSALSDLQSVGALVVAYNPSLSSLSGLASLTAVAGSLIIVHNDAMLTLAGLESVSQIGGRVYVDNNAQLTSVQALCGITINAMNVYLGADHFPSLSFCQYTSSFDNRASLLIAVGSWCADAIAAESLYGHISYWDISRVTDMGWLFNQASCNSGLGNVDLNAWDVSRVTDMHSCFRGASSFSSDLNAWDVSRVTSMAHTFDAASSFQSLLNAWDVSRVTSMYRMFSGASSLTGDLSGWDVSNVISMAFMFDTASSLTSDLSAWDVSRVTSMNMMFYYAESFTSDLSAWDVSSVLDMSSLFNHAYCFTSDLSRWDVSRVTTMSHIFWATGLTDELSECNRAAIHSRFSALAGSVWSSGQAAYGADWSGDVCVIPPPASPPLPPPPAVDAYVGADGNLSHTLLAERGSGSLLRISISGAHHLLTAATSSDNPSAEFRMEATAAGAELIGDPLTGLIFAFRGSTLVYLHGLVLRGAIRYEAHASLHVDNCTFVGAGWSNHANLSALTLSAGMATLVSVRFEAASARALHVNGSTATVRASVFLGNHGLLGAAALVSSGVLHVETTLIEENEADDFGGAVAVEGGLLLLANQTQLLRNAARSAHTLYVGEAARAFYALPAPRGAWVQSPFLCDNTQNACPWQQYEVMSGLHLVEFASGATDDGEFPYLCPPGSFGEGLDVAIQSQPLCSGRCAAGTYQSQAGQTSCLACNPGYYCPSGAAALIPCPAGYFSNATGLQSANQCTQTYPGYVARAGGTQQTPCAAGTVAVTGGLACTPCAASTYQNETGQLSCRACEPGYFCPEGASAPLPCGQGTYSSATNLASAGECTETSAGYFAPTGSTEQVACAPGTIASGTRSGSCTNCAPGTYQDEAGKTSCLACTAGSYCPTGASAALPCPSGSFSAYTNLASAAGCTPANPGYYAPTGSPRQLRCRENTYNPHTGRASDAACVSCPLNSITNGETGQISVTACKCIHDHYDTGEDPLQVRCSLCPSGTDCQFVGNSLNSLPVKRGYYRLHAYSVDVRRCPDSGTNCTDSPECEESTSGCHGTAELGGNGSRTIGRRLEATSPTSNSSSGCYDDLSGVFCRLCAPRDNHVRVFYSAATASRRAECRECRDTARRSILAFIGYLALAVMMALLLFCWYEAFWPDRRKRMLRRAWKAFTPHNKLKILIGFYMIVTKVGEVYEVELPAQVASMLANFGFAVSFGFEDVGSILECLEMGGYLTKLTVYIVFPFLLALLIVLIALAGMVVKRHCTLMALLETAVPPLLKLLFLVYPLVTNVAFDAFACYKFTESEWLKTDVSIECGTADHHTAIARAWVAIFLYPIGLLALNGGLLFAARNAILKTRPTILSRSIAFLHREFEPQFFWWELVEMLRRFVLVGLMVLAQGSMVQLVMGTLLSAFFLLFQVQASPYATLAGGTKCHRLACHTSAMQPSRNLCRGLPLAEPSILVPPYRRLSRLRRQLWAGGRLPLQHRLQIRLARGARGHQQQDVH